MKQISEIKMQGSQLAINNEVLAMGNTQLIEHGYFKYDRVHGDFICTLSQEELLSLKHELAVDKDKIVDLTFKINSLFAVSNTYGKTKEITSQYALQLARYPADLLDIALNYEFYKGEFPSLYQITENIRVLGGLRGRLYFNIINGRG